MPATLVCVLLGGVAGSVAGETPVTSPQQSPVPVQDPVAPRPAAGDRFALPGEHSFVVPRGLCETGEPVQQFPATPPAATPADQNQEQQ